ncbi:MULTISPECIES: class I SAM-dependent DNA methyltransferase [Cupriavidus]|uniref:NodS n=1 Tax=Cupriavidus pinatubonensis (strain JMP 134 / LMG 1197) TaxID=264198 RepID=Q46RE8_CUPPJ|nr:MULTISPECIES: SAM-dependent methyltransferase [Cupriavidus]
MTPATSATSAQAFDAMFEQDDPWGFETLWYEARKRALLMAALPEARYARALEAGCANGILTEQLAGRCDALLAIDVAARAIDRMQTRLAGHSHVEGRVARLPQEWPGGSFDLIVLSELGYYFTPDDWIATARQAVGALTPRGTIVACHWLRPFRERQMATRDIHAAIGRQPGLCRHVRHLEPDFLLEVWSRNTQPLRMREAMR